MQEWLARCQQARSSGNAIPEAQLFRRMLTHEFCLLGSDVFASEELLPSGSAEVEPINGLQLAGTVDPEHELRVHFMADCEPLLLSPDEVSHFRSFLRPSLSSRPS